MATHSSILAWKTPRTEEPGGLHSKVWQRVRHNWVTACMPAIRTFKLRTFKEANVCLEMQCCKPIHVSGIHRHVLASSPSGCGFVYFTVYHCIADSSIVSSFQAPVMELVLLYFSRYCTTRLKTFSLFFLCLLFKILFVWKVLYYKPITVQYYIANCFVGYLG